MAAPGPFASHATRMLTKILWIYSIHLSGNLSAILRKGGGESGGGYNWGVDRSDSKHWVGLHWDVEGVVMPEGNYLSGLQQQ